MFLTAVTAMACLACFQKRLFAMWMWWMYWISCHTWNEEGVNVLKYITCIWFPQVQCLCSVCEQHAVFIDEQLCWIFGPPRSCAGARMSLVSGGEQHVDEHGSDCHDGPNVRWKHNKVFKNIEGLVYWFFKFSPPSDPPELNVYYDLGILKC